MSDLLKLAERCEAATGPDRELDVALADAMTIAGWSAIYSDVCAPCFTASLDSAMTLVPEGWGPTIDNSDLHGLAFVELWQHGVKLDSGGLPYQDRETGTAATPALALCAAALKARAWAARSEAAAVGGR